ncbi:MAG: GNAT family N-acetyltransferase, partial [Phycisphaerales bacterium]
IRRYGMRLVGPNCMGIMNMAPDVRLQASFSAHAPASGSVAFASQSGALGEIMLALLGERGLGLARFVSLGKKADVSSNALLAAWVRGAAPAAALREANGVAAKVVSSGRGVLGAPRRG